MGSPFWYGIAEAIRSAGAASMPILPTEEGLSFVLENVEHRNGTAAFTGKIDAQSVATPAGVVCQVVIHLHLAAIRGDVEPISGIFLTLKHVHAALMEIGKVTMRAQEHVGVIEVTAKGVTLSLDHQRVSSQG